MDLKDNLLNTIMIFVFGIIMGICVVGSIWVLKNKQYINPKPSVETIEERREWDIQEPIVYHPRNESSYMPTNDSEPIDKPIDNEYQPIKNIKNFD